MNNFLTKILGEKKDWKAMEARANALPRDYRIVYGEMKSYLWKFTAGDGRDIVALLGEALGLFETSAAQGRSVLDVAGGDVAGFSHKRLRGTTSFLESYLEKYLADRRTALNRDVARRLAR